MTQELCELVCRLPVTGKLKGGVVGWGYKRQSGWPKLTDSGCFVRYNSC